MSVASVPTERPKSRLRNFAVNLAVLVVTSLVCVLLLEWVVRWQFPYYSPSTQLRFHPMGNGLVLGEPLLIQRLWTPKGDYDTQVRFNAEGFRDTKLLSEATGSDWFALGDSFTMGMGVDEDKRYANVLEKLFQSNGIKASVFNIAIPDNFIGYQRLLKYAESRTININHLIVGVCMENDIRDYRDGRSSWDFQGLDVNPDGRRLSTKELLRSWFKQHSALYTALSFELQKTELGRRFFERLGVARNVDSLSRKNTFSEEALVSCRDEMLKIVSDLDAFVLICPARQLWSGNNCETEARVHERFLQLLRDANVRVVDMKPVFEHEGNPLQFYYAHDPHWNPRGHALAARELFAEIRARDEKAVSSTSQ